jgi:uncharacterized protein YigA (DUF484 family)
MAINDSMSEAASTRSLAVYLHHNPDFQSQPAQTVCHHDTPITPTRTLSIATILLQTPRHRPHSK